MPRTRGRIRVDALNGSWVADLGEPQLPSTQVDRVQGAFGLQLVRLHQQHALALRQVSQCWRLHLAKKYANAHICRWFLQRPQGSFNRAHGHDLAPLSIQMAAQGGLRSFLLIGIIYNDHGTHQGIQRIASYNVNSITSLRATASL